MMLYAFSDIKPSIVLNALAKSFIPWLSKLVIAFEKLPTLSEFISPICFTMPTRIADCVTAFDSDCSGICDNIL